MTTAAPSIPAIDTSASAAGEPGPSVFELPEGYDAVRGNTDTQFAPIELKEIKPREPSWLEEMLQSLFEWLGELFSPVGGALTSSWPVLKWVIIAALVAFVLFLAFRLISPLSWRRKAEETLPQAEPEWQPDERESLALLEDADRLAAEGRFDEAARLLLQRSVGQIASARPEWVDPSSTARELAALPRLSDGARGAFAVISAAVERSLFALNQLTREDWETARKAYTDFALARIDKGERASNVQEAAA